MPAPMPAGELRIRVAELRAGLDRVSEELDSLVAQMEGEPLAPARTELLLLRSHLDHAQQRARAALQELDAV